MNDKVVKCTICGDTLEHSIEDYVKGFCEKCGNLEIRCPECFGPLTHSNELGMFCDKQCGIEEAKENPRNRILNDNEARMFDEGVLLANSREHGLWRLDLDGDMNSEAMLLIAELPPQKHPLMLVPTSPAHRKKETTQLQIPLPNGEKDIDDLIAALQELKENLHE